MLVNTFHEARATQVAAMFLSLGGGEMNYMRLIKLMYLVDRTALLDWGRPVTYDTYVSMDNGPVLSTVYDLIRGHNYDSILGKTWREHISEPKDYCVTLKQECSPKNLSDNQEELVKQVFEEFKNFSQWKLVKYTHENCVEWQDPHGSSIPITYRDILLMNGIPDEQADEIADELENLAAIDKLLVRP